MATHSSILAWRIPRAEEPRGLQSMESFPRPPPGSQEACQDPKEKTAEPIRMEAWTDAVNRDFRSPEVPGLEEDKLGVTDLTLPTTCHF